LDGENFTPLATKKYWVCKSSAKDFFLGGKNMAQFCHISSEKNSHIIVFRH